MDPQMQYYPFPGKQLHYPCEWRRIPIPPGQREVRMEFGSMKVAFEAPYKTVDEERGACAIRVEARSPKGFLVAFPGELDGSLSKRAIVPEQPLAEMLGV